jgi:hypothetical protein
MCCSVKKKFRAIVKSMNFDIVDDQNLKREDEPLATNATLIGGSKKIKTEENEAESGVSNLQHTQNGVHER